MTVRLVFHRFIHPSTPSIRWISLLRVRRVPLEQGFCWIPNVNSRVFGCVSLQSLSRNVESHSPTRYSHLLVVSASRSPIFMSKDILNTRQSRALLVLVGVELSLDPKVIFTLPARASQQSLSSVAHATGIQICTHPQDTVVWLSFDFFLKTHTHAHTRKYYLYNLLFKSFIV